MALSSNYFAQLADQVRAGNTQVKGRIQRELEPYLQRIVARALSPRAPATHLHQRIQALTRQLHVDPDAGPEERRRLAHVLCQRVVSRLAPTDTAAHEVSFTTPSFPD